jgi:hypothetical protein
MRAEVERLQGLGAGVLADLGPLVTMVDPEGDGSDVELGPEGGP